MSERMRLAVVGLGHLGRFHAENLATRVPGADLARVSDLDGELARGIGGELEVPWSTGLAEIFDDETIAGVVVATPTSGHADVIVQAAGAGKHVFTEKPIALDWPDTRRAVAAADAAGVILHVGFHRRFDDDFRRLADAIRAGDLGPVHFLRLAHRDQFAPVPGTYLERNGSLLVDSMIHDFDTARWLAGEVETVFARWTSMIDPRFGETGDADHAIAVLQFVSGALGVIDNSRQTGYGYECTAEVLGLNAAGRISQPQVGSLSWLADGRASGPLPSDHRERHTYAYVGELQAFSDAIRCGHPSPVPGEEGARAFAISQAALRAVCEGRPVAVRDALEMEPTSAMPAGGT
jgi:predicted dehydrogenase